MPEAQGRKPDMGLRTFTPVREPLQYEMAPSLWVTHSESVSPTCLVGHSFFMSLVVGSRFFSDVCSEDSCDFGVAMRVSDLRVFLLAKFAAF